MTAGVNGFVAQLVAAVNDHDLEAVVGLFTADYVNQTPAHPARSFTGNHQVRRNWESIFAAVPDLCAVVTAQAVGEDTVWTEWTMDGSRRDGAEHHMRGVVIFTVADGRATAARFYLEPLDTGDGDVNAAVTALVQSHHGNGRP
jgi:ketosteroid isomerase-like protein